MRNLGSIAALVAAACLGGCGDAPNDIAGADHRGRYHGIGTYAAGRMWSRMVATERFVQPAAANLADDEQIIVVVDGQTGEVRQCGNLSGHCIAMNPWTGPLAEGRAVPVNLTEHAADLDRTAEVDANAAEAAAGNESRSTR